MQTQLCTPLTFDVPVRSRQNKSLSASRHASAGNPVVREITTTLRFLLHTNPASRTSHPTSKTHKRQQLLNSTLSRRLKQIIGDRIGDCNTRESADAQRLAARTLSLVGRGKQHRRKRYWHLSLSSSALQRSAFFLLHLISFYFASCSSLSTPEPCARASRIPQQKRKGI